MSDRGVGPGVSEGGYGLLVSNGVVAWLFAVTGPVAIILTVAVDANLGTALTNSWIFAAFFIGGILTLAFCVVFRQPAALAWTIPGTVLIAPALGHLAFAEVVGAYVVTAFVLLALGLSGAARRVMSLVPLPIVMGMVAGIFLPLVLRIVDTFTETPLLTGAMVFAFFVVFAFPRIGRIVPPALMALVAGAVVVALTPQWQPDGVALQIAQPVLVVPAFSVSALLELVVPLTLTVVAMQNAQGFAILKSAGYQPPEDMLTTACGVGTLAGGLLGSIPTSVAGPATGILNTSGELSRRWISGVVFGVLYTLFGLFAPTATTLALAVPSSFIVVLGGLALTPVLRDIFTGAFDNNPLPLGTLVAFVVTLSDVSILRISAAFWGLVFGLAASWLCEYRQAP